MTELLRISADLQIPKDAITQTFGVIATKGSGKTYFSAVYAEEFLRNNMPVVIFDPLGVYWGLQSSADGERAGFPIPIVGGDFGNCPLKPKMGAALADYVVRERRSLVIDMSMLRRADQTAFMTKFAEELYHKNRDPLHLIVDEADLYMSQRPSGKDESKLLGAFEDIVRRGRARGIGITMITQRPAVINKNVLTQVSTLFTLRIGGPQDRDAIKEWIRFNGDGAEQQKILASLASLPVGTGWIWSPGWLQIMKKIKVRQRYTWDSSCTPKVGEARKFPAARARVNSNDIRACVGIASEERKELVRELRAAAPRLSESIIDSLDAISWDPSFQRTDGSIVSPYGSGVDYLRELVKWYRAIPNKSPDQYLEPEPKSSNGDESRD